MKRVLYILALIPSLAFGFGATNLYQIPGGGTNMGWTRDGIQSNFQALVPYPGTGVTMTYTPSGVTFNAASGSGTFTNLGVGASNASLRIWLNNYVSNGITTTWFMDATGGVYSVVGGAATGTPLYVAVSNILPMARWNIQDLNTYTNKSFVNGGFWTHAIPMVAFEFSALGGTATVDVCYQTYTNNGTATYTTGQTVNVTGRTTLAMTNSLTASNNVVLFVRGGQTATELISTLTGWLP